MFQYFSAVALRLQSEPRRKDGHRRLAADIRRCRSHRKGSGGRTLSVRHRVGHLLSDGRWLSETQVVFSLGATPNRPSTLKTIDLLKSVRYVHQFRFGGVPVELNFLCPYICLYSSTQRPAKKAEKAWEEMRTRKVVMACMSKRLKDPFESEDSESNMSTCTVGLPL